MNAQLVSALADIITAVVAFVTVRFVFTQVREMRHATHAGAFKIAYDILQIDALRKDRAHVLKILKSKPFPSWDETDKERAERVCQSYDSIGILCKRGYLEVDAISDSWGDSLRRCWAILAILVETYRVERNSKEFWDDFQWLAAQAEQYQKRVYGK